MSKNITIETEDSLTATGVILPLEARLLPTTDLYSWAEQYYKDTQGQHLLDGLMMMSALSNTGYTLWKDLA